MSGTPELTEVVAATHGRPSGRPGSGSGGSGASSTSGSRRGKFRCTTPGRPCEAVQTARHASERIQRRRAGVASPTTPTSTNCFAAPPNSFSWSIVWPAPTSRSSGGRSVVSTISGTRASAASITAGASSAAAVPEVTVTATGRPDCFASPTAKKPETRSSTCDHEHSPGSRASDSTIGVEREPGEVQASVTPQRASSSQKARSSR